VALLTALATRRRRQVRISKDDDSTDLDRFIDDRPSPAELVDAGRRRQCLRQLLDALPMAQAEVLALHVMLGYTVEETGAMTNAPTNTVRSRLRRGLAALRDTLGGTLQPHEPLGGRDE
jgi:RNA polymerase sigma-70 factor, ECF subfamily